MPCSMGAIGVGSGPRFTIGDPGTIKEFFLRREISPKGGAEFDHAHRANCQALRQEALE